MTTKFDKCVNLINELRDKLNDNDENSSVKNLYMSLVWAVEELNYHNNSILFTPTSNLSSTTETYYTDQLATLPDNLSKVRWLLDQLPKHITVLDIGVPQALLVDIYDELKTKQNES